MRSQPSLMRPGRKRIGLTRKRANEQKHVHRRVTSSFDERSEAMPSEAGIQPMYQQVVCFDLAAGSSPLKGVSTSADYATSATCNCVKSPALMLK